MQSAHEQHATDKALGIADRRNSYIERSAWPGKRRQRRSDEDGSNVFDFDRTRGNQDPHLLHCIGQCLHGEVCLLGIARAIKSNNQAITHEHVASDAFNTRDVSNQDLAIRID